jgi:hypothetical protein
MILLHRLTPFFAALVALVGFIAMATFGIHPLVSFSISWLLVTLLFARLALWQWHSPIFWNVVGVPSVFLALAGGLFLFLESSAARWGVTGLVPLLIFLFGEHVFTYIHTPATYQAYAIEHLARALNVISMFSLGVAAFGMRVFLQTPFVLLVPAVFFLSFFLVHGTLWASKVEAHRAMPYSFGGALLMTELFGALALLPTGLYANAAWLAISLYLYLGFIRAAFLDSLSRSVAVRYLTAGVISIAVIAATAQWR